MISAAGVVEIQICEMFVLYHSPLCIVNINEVTAQKLIPKVLLYNNHVHLNKQVKTSEEIREK